jgi:ZIP family zinc transporter
MKESLIILLISAAAGVAGTTAGGVLGIFFAKKDKKILNRVLGFAGGVMVGIVCFEMIPEALELTQIGGKAWTAVLTTVCAVFLGVLTIWFLNGAADKLKFFKTRGAGKIDKEKSMVRTGAIMLLAIAFHNFPEGMAIGSSGAASLSTGFLVAAVIAVHDVPEGMCISAPLAGGGVGKLKSVLLTALAGLTTVIGALFGLLLGGVSPVWTGVQLAVASGAMLYVTFGEMLPQIITIDEGQIPAASILLGIIFSAVIVNLV